MFAFQKGENALDILVSFLSGQVAVVGTEGKAEGNALLALGDAGAAVDVKQPDTPQDMPWPPLAQTM